MNVCLDSSHWIVVAPVDISRSDACVLHLRGVVFALLNDRKKVTLVIPKVDKEIKVPFLFEHPYLELSSYANPFRFEFLGVFFALPKIIRALLKEKSGVIYSRMSLLTFFVQAVSWCFGGFVRVTEHNGDLGEEIKFLLPARFRWLGFLAHYLQILDAKFACIVRAVTPELKEMLVRCGIPSSKIMVLSNGADTSLFTPYSRQDCLKKYSLPLKKKYIGFIGTITSWQAVDDLINAFALIGDSEIHLIIAGDGPELLKLKELAMAKKIMDRIHFLGKIDIMEAPKIISCFDIAVSPMRSELYTKSGAAKIKIRDYASCGRCILAGNSLSHLEFEQLGVLKTYIMDDISDMAEKMLELLNQPKVRKQFENSSLLYAKENFSWGEILLPLFKDCEKRI